VLTSQADIHRIPVEYRFQDRLQVPFDDHLGDSVGDRRNPERPRCSSIAFRYVDPTHGWRKVASGRHPIPDPIEILTQISVKVLALLRQKCLDLVMPEAVWDRPWILHVTAWGNGE
jgi:hypothetical protein